MAEFNEENGSSKRSKLGDERAREAKNAAGGLHFSSRSSAGVTVGQLAWRYHVRMVVSYTVGSSWTANWNSPSSKGLQPYLISCTGAEELNCLSIKAPSSLVCAPSGSEWSTGATTDDEELVSPMSASMIALNSSILFCRLTRCSTGVNCDRRAVVDSLEAVGNVDCHVNDLIEAGCASACRSRTVHTAGSRPSTSIQSAHEYSLLILLGWIRRDSTAEIAQLVCWSLFRK